MQARGTTYDGTLMTVRKAAAGGWAEEREFHCEVLDDAKEGGVSQPDP
jgi:hypothetical protein